MQTATRSEARCYTTLASLQLFRQGRIIECQESVTGDTGDKKCLPINKRLFFLIETIRFGCITEAVRLTALIS